MTDSQIEITEQPLPSCDQLDKIVQSLGLLIEMQSDRDKRQTHAMETILSRIDALDGMVNQLTANRHEQAFSDSETDDSLVKSICAKYGLATDDESSQSGEATEPDPAALNQDASEIESEATATELDEIEEVEDTVENKPVGEIPPMDLEEINAIKQKLHEKLREAEIELSVRRAKLSQREAMLEEKEARLKQELQRKTILSSENDGGQNGNTMLSRLKLHLREFTAAKMSKSGEDQDSSTSNEFEDPSEADNANETGRQPTQDVE